jgi:general secretion pathway protein D
MVLNNQTAVLKVVDEQVYFTIEQEITDATDNSLARTTYTSTIHTVPVGLVMSVTPQINNSDTVSIDVRPTISRITGFATDPVPRLLGSQFDNLVPQIQVREMESLLQVANGQTIVMGGLMQNKMDKNKRGLPLLANLPLVGNLFGYRDDALTKTELVIFLRPTVIKSAGAGFDPGEGPS